MPQEQIKFEGFEYSAKDLSEVAGLSYRQLNSRDGKDVLPSQRKTETGWRKFSSRDVFVIMVCSEIHRQFGISLESLGYIKRMMFQDKANHLLASAKMIDVGLTPCLLTNLKNSFVLQSSKEIGKHIIKASMGKDGFILLNLSPIVVRLTSYLEKTQTQSRNDQ